MAVVLNQILKDVGDHPVIGGDFNAQHDAWGSTRNNQDGIALMDALQHFLLTFLNEMGTRNGMDTRISANRKYNSVPDISVKTNYRAYVHGKLWMSQWIVIIYQYIKSPR